MILIKKKNQKKKKSKKKTTINDTEQSNPSVIQITHVIHGGFSHRFMIAAVCSNGYIALRLVGEKGVAIVKHIPWYPDQQKKSCSTMFSTISTLVISCYI